MRDCRFGAARPTASKSGKCPIRWALRLSEARASPQQQQQDQGECHVWATQTSGYDPYTRSSSHASGGLVKGGAVGAAGGAVGGAIAGNAGKGAAIGAATGALLGGVRQHQHNQSVDARTQRGQSEYKRALRVCLEGRGYAVN